MSVTLGASILTKVGFAVDSMIRSRSNFIPRLSQIVALTTQMKITNWGSPTTSQPPLIKFNVSEIDRLIKPSALTVDPSRFQQQDLKSSQGGYLYYSETEALGLKTAHPRIWKQQKLRLKSQTLRALKIAEHRCYVL